MALTKINEDELLDRLTNVFRTYGYEGASLSRISEVTGLQRASLYHRFPGGKEDMAKAVLSHAGQWLFTQVLAPLSGPGKPKERIQKMAKELHEFFGGGQHCCLLDSLSFGFDDSAINQHIRTGMDAWVDALAKIACEVGIPAKKARQHAQDAISRIEGSLVVGRVLKDYGPFERTMAELPSMLLDKK